MRRLVFVTQLLDPDDAVLGFVVPQVRALARHADVLVVANEVRAVPSDLGARVVSLGKEDGLGTARRGARYASVVASEIRRSRPTALIAHMCPIYLVLAAPVARPTRTPTLLWFVHPSDTPTLRAAERCANVVLTAFAGSYPRRGPKVKAIGHAIDTDRFGSDPVRRAPGTALRLLALGRTSTVKRYDVIVRAVAATRDRGVDVELRIVGPSVTSAEQECRSQLRALIATTAPDAVRLEPGVVRGDVEGLFRDADVLVNATASGSADKVVFESMAAGRAVLTSSPAFDPLLGDVWPGLTFPPADAEALAGRITALAALPPTSFDALGVELRGRVRREHSLEHWASSVVAEVAALERTGSR